MTRRAHWKHHNIYLVCYVGRARTSFRFKEMGTRTPGLMKQEAQVPHPTCLGLNALNKPALTVPNNLNKKQALSSSQTQNGKQSPQRSNMQFPIGPQYTSHTQCVYNWILSMRDCQKFQRRQMFWILVILYQCNHFQGNWECIPFHWQTGRSTFSIKFISENH